MATRFSAGNQARPFNFVLNFNYFCIKTIFEFI